MRRPFRCIGISCLIWDTAPHACITEEDLEMPAPVFPEEIEYDRDLGILAYTAEENLAESLTR